MTFETVNRAEVPTLRPGPGRRPLAISLSLEAGEMVWTTDGMVLTTVRSKNGYLSARGFIVRQRRSERNGQSGWYLWAEARP